MIVLDGGDRAARERQVSVVAAALKRGDLVIVPTESCYAVAADAFTARGTAALRSRKGVGPQVPLPVMVPAAATVAGLTPRIPAEGQDLMTAFWPGGLTLLLPAQATLAWDHPAAAPVAVRMPLHPVLLAVLRAVGPMAVTAANGPGMEPPTTVEAAVEQLGEDFAMALDCGQLAEGEASTVVDLTTAPPAVRRTGAIGLAELQSVCPAIIDGR